MPEQLDEIKTFIKSQIFSSIEPAVAKAVREVFKPAVEQLTKGLEEVLVRIEILESQPVTPQRPSLRVWNKGDLIKDESAQGLVVVDRETGKEETAEDLEKRYGEIESELKKLPAGDQQREQLELEGFRVAPKIRQLHGCQS